MANIITAIGVFIAVVQISFIIVKAAYDFRDKKRRATIEFYNTIYQKTSELKNFYKQETGNLGDGFFEKDLIIKSPSLKAATMDYLTLFESFAVGVRLNVYDISVFGLLTSEDLKNHLSGLRDFIEYQRIQMRYNCLFNECMWAIGLIEYIQASKERRMKVKYSSYMRKNGK
jgi:hypothetical protein